MRTPYEELEYLSDFLPDEGESVVVTRRSGELHCESMIGESNASVEPLIQSDFYGRLVTANEQLKQLAIAPVASSVIFAFSGCVGIHRLGGIGISGWYLDVGLLLLTVIGCLAWIRQRQVYVYRTQIHLTVERELIRTGLDRFRLIGAVRHQPELKTLFRHLALSVPSCPQ